MVTPKEFRLGAVSELIGMALIFLFYKWNLPFLSVSVVNAMGEAKTDYTGFREICLDSVKGSDWMGWVFPLVFILIIFATVVKGFVSNKSIVVLLHSYSTGFMLVFAFFFTIAPFFMASVQAYGMENSWAGAYLQRVSVTPCNLVFPFGIYFATTAFFSYKRLFRCYDECPKQVARYAWPFAKKSWLERNYGKKTEIVKEQCPPQEQTAIDKAVERMTGKSDEELKDILANPNDYSKSFVAAANIVLRKRQGEMPQDTGAATVETVDTEITNTESLAVKVPVAEPPVAEVPKAPLSAANVSNDKPQAVTPADKSAGKVPTPSKSHKKYYIIGGASVAVVLLVLFFCLKGGEAVKVVNVPAINEALYKGKIGKVKVQMHLMQEGDSLYGTYFYERNKQDIQLTGKVNGVRYVINEFVDGKNTGTFTMDSEYNGETVLNGTWSNGKKKLKVSLESKAYRIIPSADPEHPFVGEWCVERSDSRWELAKLGLYNKDKYVGYGFLHIKVSGHYDSFGIDSVLQLKGNKAVVQASKSYGNSGVYKFVLTYNLSDRSLEIKMEDGSSSRIPLDDRSLEQQIADFEARNQVIEEPEYDSQAATYEEERVEDCITGEAVEVQYVPVSVETDEEQEKEAEKARLQAELAAELAREAAEEDPNKIYDNADVMPKFPGGQTALMSYLAQNVKYPTIAQENGTQGKVVVQFVVDTDGSLTDIRVITSVDPYLDAEALRVIRAMPRWQPGKVNGKPARVKYTVPIMFRLS